MKKFENLRVDTSMQNEDKSVLENCCTTDCCDTSSQLSDACCDDNIEESCCDNSADAQCCDSAKSSCCEGGEKTKSQIEEGMATIDGQKVEVTSSDKNLVELAKKIGINIPAPCYFAKRKGGCCKTCVVDVDGEQKYACGTVPKKGMKIMVNRHDLKSLRKELILKYKEALKTGNPIACNKAD